MTFIVSAVANGILSFFLIQFYSFIFGCAGSLLFYGLSLVAARRGCSSCMHGLLIVMASFVLEYGLQGTWASVVAAHGLSGCGCCALEQFQ